MKFVRLSFTAVLLCVCSSFVSNGYAQNFLSKGEVHGNFETNVQSYKADSVINAPEVDEKILSNSFLNLIYTNGNFTAGVRYEAYYNPLLGFDARYKGAGFPYKFASYKANEFEVTVGNFYEQFGSGMILRSYEERSLGLDNALNGVRLKYNPIKGVAIKGLIGKQRAFFTEGEGIIRGLDGEFFLNDLCKKMEKSKTRVIFGASMVSKFQEDDDPVYVLPENVAAFAGRMNLTRGRFGLITEYAYKINDPSAMNNFIYKPGEALLLTGTYSQKGLGITLSAKRIDNMDFHSNRLVTQNYLNVNYLPAITRQHTYTLSAFYPYATQANGEMGIQGDIVYTIKKGSLLGGKYGTKLMLNYSRVNSIQRNAIHDTIAVGKEGTLGYTSDFFAVGDEKYFEDINIEIAKKLSKKLKFSAGFVNQFYNKAVVQGTGAKDGMVHAQIALLDVTYKLKPKHALRLELQHLKTKQDMGDWAMGLIEYTIAPKWFFTVMDQYNYGNKEEAKQVHYYSAAFGYMKGANRIQFGYGKQREGIVCVGGVCRAVPAANGFTLSITSSF